MSAEWVNRHTTTPKARRLFEQERLILWVTDSLYEALEENAMSKSDLAEKLGTSRAYITQVLNGSRNMSLSTMADLAWAVGCRATVALEPLRDGEYMCSPLKLAIGKRQIVQARVRHPSRAGGPSQFERLVG